MRKLYPVAILIMVALTPICKLYAQEISEKTVLDLVKTNAAQLHISPADAGNASISSYFTDAVTGILHAYIQQTWEGIKVHNTIITAAFRDNKLLYTSGKFVNDIASKAGQAAPSIPADQAVTLSAQHLQLTAPVNLLAIENKFIAEKKIIFSPAGIAKQNIETELFWVTDDELQTIKLAWNVNIDVAGSSNWWNVRIDALTGNVIDKDNWTVHEDIQGLTHSGHSSGFQNNNNTIAAPTNIASNPPPPPAVTNAAYKVVRFPGENPVSGTIAVENEPWLKAGAVNNATTDGWHYDGTTDYNITRGNNVFAYLDILNNNTASATNFPDTSITPVPVLNFVNPPNFAIQPSDITNRKFALDNLFYWNNLMHDVMYQYGFDEASGNFQADNLGRGGAGNDFVRAEAQDASGTNNANFSTPADGGSGRMQMYLWSAVPSFVVNSPAAIAGSYQAVEGAMSATNLLQNTGPVTGQVVFYNDDAGGTAHLACVAPPANTISGKIALIIRGSCNFTVKVKNAQNAGAIAVIMVNNVPGSPITMGGGPDNTITIPAVMISDVDGATIAAQLANNVNVTLSAGVGIDGDIDNGVVCHEYGHGISNRLTGGRNNASCLANAEQGGEGWSDYMALMMVTNWSTAQLTDGNLPRTMGTYALGEPATGSGIRTYPYTLNMAVNPHTYADLANVSTEVHYIGEVWTSALWDMTWNIIQMEGVIDPNIYNATGPGGNAIALRLVMEGMRLQSCRPGFLDARNAILAADSILYNFRHKCAIWNAFARRGMGYSAIQGSSGSATDQVAAFDLPSSITLAKSAAPVAVAQGSQVTVNLSASCQCQVPSNNNIIRDTIPAGFTYVNSTGGTLNGNVVTFSPVSFTTALETKTYSVTLQATTGGCNIDTAINDNRDGATTGGLTSAASTGVTQWVQSSTRFSSPSNSWFAANSPGTTDFTLTSNAFTAGSLSILSFKHYYVTENYIDGGKIEISNDNGLTWLDAGPYIIQNGYNTTMNVSSPWGSGQRAFSGVSYGQGNGQFINTVLDLSSFSGQSVIARLRMRSNASNASGSTYEGWFVDDVLQMNGCGGIVKAGLYNSSGTRIDSSVVPVFVKSSGIVSITTQPSNTTACEGSPVTFTVAAAGSPLPTYQWQLSTDGGTTYNNLAGQTASTLTVTATAALNGDRYRCIASNSLGSATSNAVTLTVSSLVTVTTQPVNVTQCAGTNAGFTVAANGSGTLGYQWQLSTDGGTTYNNLTGQTSSTLNFAVTNVMNGYRYRCAVTGTCGTINSNAATLTLGGATSITITALPSKICLSDTAIHLGATPIGGVWSGTGISGNNFVPTAATLGSYLLTYTYADNSGCISTATTTAKVEDCPERIVQLSDNALILYPNPNNGQFNIRVNSVLYSYLVMKVFANNGALLRTQQLNGLAWGRIIPVDLSYLPGSVYMVKFYYGDGTGTAKKTFKVIVAH
ncbi:MAG: M36 family metallopeptidase [Bacteroidota bacterium]|nr:M36 family metallopeptidase [Bacteroidota bacterium]